MVKGLLLSIVKTLLLKSHHVVLQASKSGIAQCTSRHLEQTRHSIFCIFLLFRTYTTVSATYQRHKKLALSTKHPRVGWGEQACTEAAHISSSGAASLSHHHEAHLHRQCSWSTDRPSDQTSLGQMVAETPFPGKAEVWMICVMTNPWVSHTPYLKYPWFRFCTILKEPFLGYLKATAHISQNTD